MSITSNNSILLINTHNSSAYNPENKFNIISKIKISESSPIQIARITGNESGNGMGKNGTRAFDLMRDNRIYGNRSEVIYFDANGDKRFDPKTDVKIETDLSENSSLYIMTLPNGLKVLSEGGGGAVPTVYDTKTKQQRPLNPQESQYIEQTLQKIADRSVKGRLQDPVKFQSRTEMANPSVKLFDAIKKIGSQLPSTIFDDRAKPLDEAGFIKLVNKIYPNFDQATVREIYLRVKDSNGNVSQQSASEALKALN